MNNIIRIKIFLEINLKTKQKKNKFRINHSINK